jgi:hypothetical protein
MSELISLREYGRRRGVTLGAVQKAIKSGRIKLVDGKVDPEVADIMWARNTTPMRAAPGPVAAAAAIEPRASARASRPPAAGDGDEPTGDGLHVSRARREAALAELAELELAEKRGELVSAVAIEKALATKILSVRESLDTLTDRITPLLAAESDPARIYALLRAEMRQALSQLSNESRGPAAMQ